MVNGNSAIPNSPQEEFDNWDEESRSNERYSEFLSRNRTKPAPNAALSRFQVYDLVENGVDTGDEGEEVSTETLMTGLGPSSLDLRKNSSAEFEEKILGSDRSVDSLAGDETTVVVAAASVSSDLKSEDTSTSIPPLKTRSHRSPSVERREEAKKKSAVKKSSRFKKDAYCDSFLDSVTLRSFEQRIEQLLVSEGEALSPESDSEKKKSVPYAYAARVMGLIEIAATPRVTRHLFLSLSDDSSMPVRR
jgi:hypothetical protein